MGHIIDADEGRTFVIYTRLTITGGTKGRDQDDLKSKRHGKVGE